MSPAGRARTDSRQPTFFIDRSLGRVKVARLLRGAGLSVVTLAEHYGMPQDETIEDVTWLEDASARGWPCLLKDERIRRRPAEKAAIRRHGARCFYFTRGDLPTEAYVERVLTNLDAIVEVCANAGPFVYVIHPNRIERMSV